MTADDRRINAGRTVCLLGLGEVGSTLARDLARGGDPRLVAWDRQFGDPASIPSRHAARQPGLRRAAGAADAARDCELVISAVTAAQALAAAESVLPGLQPNAWFLDLNSVSPDSKRALARAVEAAGGRFVEAAVMSPIAPAGIASPMLVAGPHATDFVPLAQTLGFERLRVCSRHAGHAAATKMCRSVVVKGLEALVAEALLAARHYGVEADVIASLGDLFPQTEWQEYSRYLLSRSLRHGLRRAEEMREAARTVREAGIEPWMSEACAQRQEWASRFAAALPHRELAPMLDAILAANAPTEPQRQPL